VCRGGVGAGGAYAQPGMFGASSAIRSVTCNGKLNMKEWMLDTCVFFAADFMAFVAFMDFIGVLKLFQAAPNKFNCSWMTSFDITFTNQNISKVRLMKYDKHRFLRSDANSDIDRARAVDRPVDLSY
jgi:hypothetical protein